MKASKYVTCEKKGARFFCRGDGEILKGLNIHLRDIQLDQFEELGKTFWDRVTIAGSKVSIKNGDDGITCIEKYNSVWCTSGKKSESEFEEELE